MSLFQVGLLYDGEAEPDQWHETAATGSGVGGRTLVRLPAPRRGGCRMVLRRSSGDELLWRGTPVEVLAGDVVWQEFGVGSTGVPTVGPRLLMGVTPKDRAVGVTAPVAAPDSSQRDVPPPASVLALRAAIMHVERTFDNADGEALADALTVAVVDAGWRPAVTS